MTTKPQSTTEPNIASCEWCKQEPETGAFSGKPITTVRCLNRSCPVSHAGWMAVEYWCSSRVSPCAAPVVDNWSKESPKVNGVYWWRADVQDNEPDIHSVVAGHFYQIGSLESVVVENFGGEWLGPITPAAATAAPQLNELQEAYNQGVEDAKCAIRAESQGGGYWAATYINGIARRCSPFRYTGLPPDADGANVIHQVSTAAPVEQSDEKIEK